MPDPAYREKTAEDRDWYRSEYDYAKRWRFRSWGQMHQQTNKPPLRQIFMAGAFTHAQGLAWLKSKLYIGLQIQAVEELHPDDVDFLFDLAESRFSMEWIEDLRERYEKSLQKSA